MVYFNLESDCKYTQNFSQMKIQRQKYYSDAVFLTLDSHPFLSYSHPFPYHLGRWGRCLSPLSAPLFSVCHQCFSKPDGLEIGVQ